MDKQRIMEERLGLKSIKKKPVVRRLALVTSLGELATKGWKWRGVTMEGDGGRDNTKTKSK
jgi:hypothetical protein